MIPSAKGEALRGSIFCFCPLDRYLTINHNKSPCRSNEQALRVRYEQPSITSFASGKYFAASVSI